LRGLGGGLMRVLNEEEECEEREKGLCRVRDGGIEGV
jgi:hypothetical protein